MQEYKTVPDSTLINLLREGNHNAYTELFNRYHYSMITFAIKKMGDKDLAQDVVQDIFVNLWVNKANIKPIENLAAYLIVSVKRRLLNLYDHEKVKTKYASSLAAHSLNYVENTDYIIREKEFTKYIKEQINTLPEKMRHTFVLSRIQHYSNKEIALNSNTSESNVSKHVHSALKILKSKLYNLFF